MIYFIADLHLNDEQPHLTQLFLQFMQQQALQAEAVYILGDLFDFWIGDDEQSFLISQVKHAIKSVTERGIPCYFVHGNRDFLLGKQFAKETGLILLGDYTKIDLFGHSTLICHGDTLCIDDTAYQTFRHKVHQRWRQRLFLCLPLRLRVYLARKIRQKSQQEKRTKQMQIMDVNSDFTLRIMQQYQAKWLIHGHTHRQGVHQYSLAGNNEATVTRIVLGDWGKTASILAVDNHGFSFNEER